MVRRGDWTTRLRIWRAKGGSRALEGPARDLGGLKGEIKAGERHLQDRLIGDWRARVGI